jgi:hypothetical protein
MVNTDLSRDVKEKSVFMRIVAPLALAVIAKNAEDGARTYVQVGSTTKEDHVSTGLG